MFKKGHRHSAATKRKMSLKARGKNNPFYGKTHTKEALLKIRKASWGKNNPMHGKHHTAQARNLISEAQKLIWSFRRKAFAKKSR